MGNYRAPSGPAGQRMVPVMPLSAAGRRSEARNGSEEGGMTTDEKLKLAVSVARAAARSGEYRRLDTLIEVVFRKLNELAPSEPEIHDHERDFKL